MGNIGELGFEARPPSKQGIRIRGGLANGFLQEGLKAGGQGGVGEEVGSHNGEAPTLRGGSGVAKMEDDRAVVRGGDGGNGALMGGTQEGGGDIYPVKSGGGVGAYECVSGVGGVEVAKDV